MLLLDVYNFKLDKYLTSYSRGRTFEIKINSLKWYIDTAKNLIVEWLSIDKYNRELNLELASIYEKEHNYINAEYIYKDFDSLLEETNKFLNGKNKDTLLDYKIHKDDHRNSASESEDAIT